MTRQEAIQILRTRIVPTMNWQEIHDAIDMAIEALSQESSEDVISRQAAIDALWKALYEYEDVTEKQFIESEELDVGNWFQHRIFVQNMSDIDRQTILALPSAQPEQRWIPVDIQNNSPEENEAVLLGVRFRDDFKCFVTSRQDYNYWTGLGREIKGELRWMPLPEPYKEEDNERA